MSSYSQNSNPFHQYDTRYKPSLPQRTNAIVPNWMNSNTNVVTFNPVNYSHHITTVTTSGPNNVPMFTTTYYNKK
jgi:hypothetical protein